MRVYRANISNQKKEGIKIKDREYRSKKRSSERQAISTNFPYREVN